MNVQISSADIGLLVHSWVVITLCPCIYIIRLCIQKFSTCRVAVNSDLVVVHER